eukprot:COSAG04_NODE_1173_length_7934_cov_6.964523_8_plen_74_part_01
MMMLMIENRAANFGGGPSVMAPTVVVVSGAERAAGRLTPASLATAAAALRADGVVVLDRAMEPATLARLAARMA